MKYAYIINKQYAQLLNLETGQNHFAANDHPNFEQIVKLLRKSEYSVALKLFDIKKIIETQSKGKFLIRDNEVLYNGTPVHNTVTERILECSRNNGDVKPLVNFLERLLNNPHKVIFDNLYKYLENYKLPIDQDGYVYGIKAVRPDLKSKWSSSVQYVIGETYSEPRQFCRQPGTEGQQNDIYCGPGLWFGWTTFVLNYGSPTDHVILVKVDPKNIIATPNLARFQKIACCEFTPVKDLGRVSDLKGYFVIQSNIAEKCFTLESAPSKQTNYNPKIGPKRDRFGRFTK